MDAHTAHQSANDLHFIDVREQYEWKAGHISGSAHIPLSEIPSRADELPVAQRVVTVCKVGARSDEAARFLVTLGIDAENLEGGLLAWDRAGFELVKPDGSPGRVVA